jgi:hypothetical protein
MAIAAESTEIFRRVIEPQRGTFAPELARYVLELDFGREDHERYEHLSAKAEEGALSAEELSELDGYLHVDSLLAILRLKAQRSLERESSRESSSVQ